MTSGSCNHDFKPVWMNKKELINLKNTNNIQKNVINRLYYNEKTKLSSNVDLKQSSNIQHLPDINLNSQGLKKRCISKKLVN